MSISQAIDAVFIIFILSGFLAGFRAGLISKIVDIIFLFFTLFLTYKFGASLKGLIGQFISGESLSFIKNGILPEYLSALVATHLVNILSYLAFFIAVLILSKIVKKMVRKFIKKHAKRKVKKGAMNRLFGGLWGAGANAIFMTAMMVVLIPFVGLSSVIKNETLITKYLYNAGITIEKQVYSNNSSGEEQGEGHLLVILSNKQITEEEAVYVYSAIETLTSQVINAGTFCALYCNLTNYNVGTPEYNSSIDRYFQDIYGIAALVKLTGQKNSEELKQKTESLISNLLVFIEDSTFNYNYIKTKLTADSLYRSIDSVFDEIGLSSELKERVLIYINNPDD